MSAPKRSAPGREIAGAPKLRLTQSYVQCVHTAIVIERMPAGYPHYAAGRCVHCGRHIRWSPKPETIERRQLNAIKLAKLAFCAGLNVWQRDFVRDISQQRCLSPRQQRKLD